ncbi:MAG: type II toxin-antitoxin system HigB family toxin [Chloroflexota bacterium]
MRVIAKRTLREFWQKNAQAKRALQAWLEDAERADWKTQADIQRTYGDDVILPDNRAVFNIKGNHYRLVVKIHYNRGAVYIRFIGTHREYDRVDVLMI